MKHILLGAAASLFLGACVIIDAENASVTSSYTGNENAIKIAITDVLETQNAAWNRGDIDAFMEGYWKSEALRFGSGGTVTKGWQGTIDRYKTGYADRAAMGRLDFTDLDIQVFSDNAAIVHGRWALERASDRPSGLFTLVFRDFGDGWVIVSDTTTSAS